MIKSINSIKDLKSSFIATLPRGGHVVNTSQGLLQVGSPPETIKDSISHSDDVPRIFCVAESFFSYRKGINVAELEFPIYYNFFIKKRKTVIIASKRTCYVLEKVIKLILLAEDPMQIKKDYNPKSKLPIPDIKKEVSFFLNYSFQDIVEFLPLNRRNQYKLGDVHIKYSNNKFVVTDKGRKNCPNFSVPLLTYPKLYQSNQYPLGNKSFIPPNFGMTCLGASHGFDPLDNTSGFIFWINGSGIIVDPPVNATDIMHNAGISPKLLNSMILTHIHADHDSGFFQKILEQNRIKVYTTQTVMDMWLKKYSLITSLSTSKIKSLFDFFPVMIDKPIDILGAEFIFRYMIHSIPTVGFTFKLRNKTITFSSDHLNEPVFFKELLDSGYITKDRYKELMDFPWNSDIIYHEAGIPPLHTPVAFLASLHGKTKKKISLYHISKSSVPQNSKLSRCESGIQNTTTYKVKQNKDDEKKRLANIFSQNILIRKYGINREQCNSLFNPKYFRTIELSPGEILYQNKSQANNSKDNVYMVTAGALELITGRGSGKSTNNTNNYKNIIPAYQLIANYGSSNIKLRSLTKTRLVSIEKQFFLSQINNKKFEITLDRGVLLDIRAWETLKASDLITYLTFDQRADMLNLMTLIDTKKANSNYKISQSSLHLFHSGTIRLNQDNRLIKLNKGNGWGQMTSTSRSHGIVKLSFLSDKKWTKTPSIEVEVGTIYCLNKEFGEFFLKENPGLLYRYTYSPHQI